MKAKQSVEEKIVEQWKEMRVTPCCKTRHWHFINADGRYGDFIRCESCNGKFDKELLEKVVRGLNPTTYFCDRCGISAEILVKQEDNA